MPIALVPQSTDVAGGSNAQLLKAMKERKALAEMLAGGTPRQGGQERAPAFAPSSAGQAAFGYAGVAANALGDRAVLEREKADQAKRLQAGAESLKAIVPQFKDMPTATIMGLMIADPELPSKLAVKQFDVNNREPKQHVLNPGQSLVETGRPSAPVGAPGYRPPGPAPDGPALAPPSSSPASAPPPSQPALPGNAQVLVPGMSLREKEFEEKYAPPIAKMASETLDRGNNAAVQKQRIALAQRMMQDVQTGKLTPMQSTVGGYMQALGIDPKMFGIDPKTPMTAQALAALTSELVVGKIGAGGFPANNFSNPDREFLVQGVFSLGDTPEANKIKLEVARRVAELDERKANAWATAREKGASYESFEAGWRKGLGEQSIFGDLIEQATGRNSQMPQNSLAAQAGVNDIGPPGAAPPADPLGIR